MGLFGGTPNRPFGKMPKHANCCVPLCTNNFRNNSGLTFYRIPKEKSIRREYVCLIQNKNLKLECNSTRVCSAHWSGGKKLCHQYFLGVRKKLSDRFWAGRNRLQMCAVRKRELMYLRPKWMKSLFSTLKTQDADSITVVSLILRCKLK